MTEKEKAIRACLAEYEMICDAYQAPYQSYRLETDGCTVCGQLPEVHFLRDAVNIVDELNRRFNNLSDLASNHQ